MIRTQFSFVSKYENMDHSLCSFYLEQHGPLACPYETNEKASVKRMPQ